MRKPNTNPEDLLALREMLPYGSQKKIKKTTGFSLVYIGEVLGGRQEINDTNIVIVDEAIKLAEESKKMVSKKMTNLNRFLSKHKA